MKIRMYSLSRDLRSHSLAIQAAERRQTGNQQQNRVLG